MSKLWRLAAFLTVASLPFIAQADPKPAPAAPEWQPKVQAGPLKVPLGHLLTLDLPAGYMYINPADAKKVLESSGNFMGDNFLGMVLANDPTGKADYWISLEYDEEGHIKDDEKIDATAILKTMQEGQEEANKYRAEKGFPPLYLDGWGESPRYEQAQHHLVWALNVHSDRGKSVNFNTRILGRKGYVSINLITSPEQLAAYKPDAEKILAATTFDSGARYSDFNGKTDKVAEYGLAALIAGGAGIAALKIAKVGILGAFFKPILGVLIALKKLVILLFVAIGGFFKKLFGGKKDERPAPPSMVNTQGNPPAPASGTPSEPVAENDAPVDPDKPPDFK
jgi:uncharacterized membrane-anchored protein